MAAQPQSSPDRVELKAGWKNEVHVKEYSKQEISKHKTKKDIWIAIHGKVYDVTEYLRDHPGGADALLEIAGQDATSAYEDVGHSEDAREIMHTYLVGVLQGAPTEENQPSKSTATSTTKIIRRDPVHESKGSTSILLNPRVELAAFAVGAAGLAWGVNNLSLGDISYTGSPLEHGGFNRGFLTASAMFGIVGIAGARYLSKGSSKTGFSSYPARIESASPRGGTYHPAGVLNQTEYGKFKLRRKEELADGIFRFVFDLPTNYSILGLPIGQHVAIKGVIDEHTVVRSYTPISNNRDLGRLELLIRVYPKGLMGNYLKGLSIGEVAEIRGPKGAMRYRKGMSRSIGMIGGGTGITPLFQLIRSICEDENDNTQVSLIYGNRSESDIMLKDRMDNYAKIASHKFKIHYTLDQPGPDWKGGRGHVTKDLLRERLPAAAADTKILLCGPPGMVNAMKNNLMELGFEGPGAVSKMTDQIFCF